MRSVRSEMTAPPFWARPVWSSAAYVPALDGRGRCEDLRQRDHTGAADADDAHARSCRRDTRRSGSAGAATDPASGSCARLPGTTVRNDGQSPARQEKSRLQDDWSIFVLRPYSVSTGWTDRQLDFLPQSPQPSQTRSLMSTRLVGCRRLAPPTLATLLGRALLVVDQHGDAGNGGELPLCLEQVVPMTYVGLWPQLPSYGGHVVGCHDDAGDALGLEQRHQLGQRALADRASGRRSWRRRSCAAACRSR